MKYLLPAIVLLFLPINLVLAQQTSDRDENESSKLVAWIGQWDGELSIKSAQKNQVIEMTLSIEQAEVPDTFTWKISYGSPDGQQKKHVRNYLMRYDAESKTKWILDEQNGVELPVSMLGNQLLCRYSTSDLDMLTSYEIEHDTIRYQMTITSTSSQSVATGLSSNEVISTQRSILSRSRAGKNTEESDHSIRNCDNK